MKSSFKILGIATLVLLILAYVTGGFPLIQEGLLNAWDTFLQAVPLLLVAFLVTGQISALISEEWVDRILQKFAGLKGITLSALAGGLFPGPPYVYYPFVGGLKERNIPSYLFFSFIAGKQIFNFTRFPLEASLIAPEIALLRNLTTIFIPPVMGYIFYRLFSTNLRKEG